MQETSGAVVDLSADSLTDGSFRPSNAILPRLHGATVFLSAFLLFSLQPLMAKLLLPAFGGSASVWSACMLFFQLLLVAGYAYADVTCRRLRPEVHGRVHILLLAAGAALMPVHLNAALLAGQPPGLRIPVILALAIGLPYLGLSATSPLVQVWCARMAGNAPYRLYALSNLASLIALVSYPSVIEPWMTLRAQIGAWSALFVLFAALCGAAAFRAGRGPSTLKEPGLTRAIPKVTPTTRMLWVALSALASALLLATTNHLCQNVAPVPFLWILPLVAYLLSLILCFDYDSPRRRRVFLYLMPFALAGMASAAVDANLSLNARLSVPLFTAGLFVACMGLHGELVARKPPPEQLTSFYLMISMGGAAGSAVVAWVAPAALRGVFELPLLLAATALFLLFRFYRRRWWTDVLWAATSVATVVFATAQIRAFSGGTRIAVRNFYGSLRVVDSRSDASGKWIRSMVHGTTLHGAQFLDHGHEREATAYYARGSGIQLALDEFRRAPRSAAIVGLGVGTVATYLRPGDRYVFYELNPQVIQLARQEFTFLRDPAVEVVEGDGRLTIARDPRTFDVIAVDAFSGDAIPVHLMTAEAVQVYLRHLKGDGILAFHISNTVLDLEPAAATLAESCGLAAVLVASKADPLRIRADSIWVLMARSPGRLRWPALDQAARPLRHSDRQRLWTDDYSNLFQLIKTKEILAVQPGPSAN